MSMSLPISKGCHQHRKVVTNVDVAHKICQNIPFGQRLNKKRVLLKLQALGCGSVVASRDALGMRQIVDPQNRPNWILI